MRQFIIYNHTKDGERVREHRIIKYLRKNLAPFLDVGSGSKRIPDAVKAITLDVDRRTKPDIIGDICHLPLRDHSFETVSAFEVIEHLEEDEDALLELKRVSRNKVVLSVPNADRYNVPFHLRQRVGFMDKDHKREYTIKEILQLISKAGLRKDLLRGIGYLIPPCIGFEILTYFLPWFSTWIYIESSVRKK